MASNKTEKYSGRELWVELGLFIQTQLPQFSSVLADEETFISLHIKARDDGSFMGVLKQFGADGGPMVLFGAGYGIAGVLISLEGSVAAGSWRPDKPWAG